MRKPGAIGKVGTMRSAVTSRRRLVLPALAAVPVAAACVLLFLAGPAVAEPPWSLVYRLPPSAGEVRVAMWNVAALVPVLGAFTAAWILLAGCGWGSRGLRKAELVTACWGAGLTVADWMVGIVIGCGFVELYREGLLAGSWLWVAVLVWVPTRVAVSEAVARQWAEEER